MTTPCIIMLQPVQDEKQFYFAKIKGYKDKNTKKDFVLNFLNELHQDDHTLMESYLSQHQGKKIFGEGDQVEAPRSHILSFAAPQKVDSTTDHHIFSLDEHPLEYHGEITFTLRKGFHQEKGEEPLGTIYSMGAADPEGNKVTNEGAGAAPDEEEVE